MYRQVLKRFCDFLLGSILIICFLIPALLIAFILIFEHKEKAIFLQKRAGYLGKEITIYKFRTMNSQRDKMGNLLPDFLRITPFGAFLRKTSLDELPQLINVLEGSLSLVGPRPLICEYLSFYSPEQAKRHLVKPGITGLAQVKGRNALSWEEKFSYDIFYVKNLSFYLDLKILFLTIFKVIFASDKEFLIPKKFQGTPKNELQNMDITA